MRLVYTHDVPRFGVMQTCRHSRIGPIAGLILIAGCTIWWTVAVALDDDASWYHWLPVVLGLVMIMVTAGFVRKSLVSSNWVVKIAQDALYIKLRSYLNTAFKETTPIVLQLPYTDIASVGSCRRRLSIPTSDGGTSNTSLTCLDIQLRRTPTPELEEALRAERAIRPVRNGAAKFHDYALRIAGPTLLRLRWTFMPGIGRAIDKLAVFTAVHEAQTGSPIVWASADDETRDNVIRELAEFGDKLTVTKLVADRFGLERREAKDYVEKLMGIDPE